MSHLCDFPEEVEGKKGILKNVVVQINKWEPVLVQNESDMSYNGYELRMLIHDMELITNQKLEFPKDQTNIFNNEIVCSHLDFFKKNLEANEPSEISIDKDEAE